MVLVLLLLETAAGEYGPGHAEGQEAGGGTGDEDVLKAQAEIEWTAGVVKDITNTEPGGSAVEFFVYLRTIRIKERVAVRIGFLDIGGAEGIAGEGFDIETGAGGIEGMAIAYEKWDEDEVGLVWGKIVDACLDADLIAFARGKAAMEEGAEAGGRLSFEDQVGNFQLCV